jgi:hypothetical protein
MPFENPRSHLKPPALFPPESGTTSNGYPQHVRINRDLEIDRCKTGITPILSQCENEHGGALYFPKEIVPADGPEPADKVMVAKSPNREEIPTVSQFELLGAGQALTPSGKRVSTCRAIENSLRQLASLSKSVGIMGNSSRVRFRSR